VQWQKRGARIAREEQTTAPIERAGAWLKVAWDT
jgi:hypothetical protein